MTYLIELNNIENIIDQGKKYTPWSSNKLVSGIMPGVEKAILKFDPISACEVLGYQIASAIGVNVPKMQGFWTPKTVGIHSKDGRIGVLIEYFEDWKGLHMDEAAKLDSVMTTRALALCAFDRCEWGEFGISNSKVYFIDLERLLAPISPDLFLSQTKEEGIKWLDGQASIYKNIGFDIINEVLEEADSLGLKKNVEIELKRLCSLSPDKYIKFLRIDGHPLSDLISRYSAYNFGNRLNSIALWFDLRTHKVPEWRYV